MAVCKLLCKALLRLQAAAAPAASRPKYPARACTALVSPAPHHCWLSHTPRLLPCPLPPQAINLAAGGNGSALTPQDIALAAAQHARLQPQPPSMQVGGRTASGGRAGRCKLRSDSQGRAWGGRFGSQGRGASLERLNVKQRCWLLPACVCRSCTPWHAESTRSRCLGRTASSTASSCHQVRRHGGCIPRVAYN